jgi:hypothetical protein
MAVLVEVNEKRGTTTIRHNWRFEVFCEYGDDPLVKGHRQEVVFETDTGETIKITKDRVVERKLSELPEQVQAYIVNLGLCFDTFEAQDIQAEQDRLKNL